MEGSHPYQERKDSYHLLHRMYKERYGESFPRMRFNLDDRGSSYWPASTEHSMCHRLDEPWRRSFTGPDWTFCHWPSSGVEDSPATFKEMSFAGDLAPQSDKVAWFGNVRSAGSIMPESVTRHRLVEEFGRHHGDKFEFRDAGIGTERPETHVSMPDMVRRYRYLLDIGGAGYSGRLKFLLFSGRPLLLVDRSYVEYFHEDLEPFVHYIPVKSDLSDLIVKHNWMVENREGSEQIAKNARDYATKNITIDKAVERIREVCLRFMSEGRA